MASTPFMPNAEIVSKLFELEKRIEELESGKVRDEIAEVSLSGACKLMNRGHESIIKLIKSGSLPAAGETIIKHTKTGKKKLIHYRIRVKDIREYQDKRIIETKQHDQGLRESITDTFKQIINEFNQKRPKIKSK
jgi:hypothetical protein